MTLQGGGGPPAPPMPTSDNLSTDGSGILRDCLQLYTGGEALFFCYAHQAQGVTCLCSH